MLKILKHIVIFLISCVISIFVCYNSFDNIVFNVSQSNVVYIGMRILLAFGIYNLTISFINKKIKTYQINTVMILYIMFILSLSFFRGNYGHSSSLSTAINVNPLNIIKDFKNSDNTFLLIIGNIFVYIPIGIYFRYLNKIKNNKNLIIIFVLCIILIETIQYVFRMGVWDINDIILNTLGFSIGVIIINKLYTRKNHNIKSCV